MRTILYQDIYPDHWNDRILNELAREDPVYAYLAYFRDRLRDLGYELHTADNRDLADCEWVIFNDAFSMGVGGYPSHWVWQRLKHSVRNLLRPQFRMRELYQECLEAGLAGRVALWVLEPPAVRQENWDPALHGKFPVVFTYVRTPLGSDRFHLVPLPSPDLFPAGPFPGFRERQLLVCVQGNKYSRHRNELYSARRRSIAYFEERFPEDFHLYGAGWNEPATTLQKIIPKLVPVFRSYRGPVRHKAEVLPHYRYCLVYENCQLPGWISEKFFDAIRAGCVPVYLGAPDVAEIVPSEVFIDRRAFASDAEVGDFIISLSEYEYDRRVMAGRQFLASDRFYPFTPSGCADAMISAMGLSNISPESLARGRAP